MATLAKARTRSASCRRLTRMAARSQRETFRSKISRPAEELTMTRLCFMLTAFLSFGSVAQAPVAAQTGASGVTGAGEAFFPNGTTFNGVPLRGLTLGQGIFTNQGSAASGQFEA